MSAGIRDLFPLGDIDASVVAAAAERFPTIPVGDVAAGLALGRAVLQMLEELPRPIFDAGLSPARWRLLIALIAQAGPEGARIGELATHLGVKEPTVTATVDRAEGDGLVERSRDPEDGRIVRVSITPAGLAAVGGLIPTISKRMSALVTALGGAEATADMARHLEGAVVTAMENG